MDIFDLGSSLFGRSRAESDTVETNATTRTYVGTATSSSADGSVYVELSEDVTMPDEYEGEHGMGVEMPTVPGVREGDEVLVTVFGGGVMKSPVVTGNAGEGDRQDAAISDAQRAAEVAWDWADEAHTAAEQAQIDAADAALSAADAAASASDAASSASTASASAQQAVSDASTAATAATSAQASAASAESAAQASAGSASSAATSASQAQTSAGEALTSAQAAQASAASANESANAALTQLSIVEDVSGTLSWIRDHGTYRATTDTTVHEGTVYFELVSGDYVPISSPDPSANPQSSGWYVLDITDSQTDYIMAHLAVTSAGLWVLPSGIGQAADAQHAAGYKALLAATGMTVYDGNGTAVVTYGSSTTFSTDRDWMVGNQQAFVFYDASENTLQIGGANVTIGGKAPADLLTSLDVSATQTATGADITINGTTVSLTNGAAGEDGAQILGITTAPSSYTTQTGGFTPAYRISLSTVKTQSGASEVKVGDVLAYSYYHYPVGYVSSSYVYCGERKSIRGATGEQGIQGETGPAGTSVTITSIQYGTSASASTQPSNWSTTVPTSIAKGQWLWVKTSYSDNTEATTKSYVGTDGEDGTSVYVQSATKSGDTTTVVIADSEGHTTTLTIKDGEDGENGTDGTNGLTGYVHTAWANSADGTTDFSTTVSAGKSYLGVYTDNTAADSTSPSAYSWSLIKGDTGAQGPQGATGPEAVVTITPTAISWANGTATLQATLRVNGTITTSGVSYVWTKGTSTTSLGTSRTLSVTDLNATYNCTCTW